MKVAELVHQFIASRELAGLRPRTLEWYHYNLDPLVQTLGDRSIQQLTGEDLETFLAGQAHGRSLRTLEGFFTALTVLFNWAVERGYLSTNPMRILKSPGRQRRKQKKIPDVFNDAEIRALLMACDNRRDRAILLILLDTGLRRDELLGLNVEDVDFAEGFLLIRGGKGGKDRYVPVGNTTIAALREILLEHPGNGTLFRNRFGDPLEKGGLRSMLNRLKERAGLTCRVHPHKFRHTFARNYLRRGGDLESLRDILGHEDIRITAEIYSSFTRGGLKEKHRACSPVDNANWEQQELWKVT